MRAIEGPGGMTRVTAVYFVHNISIIYHCIDAAILGHMQ